MPVPTGYSAARTSSCSTSRRTHWDSIATILPRRTTSRRSISSICPVNKPIIVRLRSKDVIHSFGVPEFRVKQDAIPGLTIPIWFIPTITTAEMRTRTGNPEFQYEIACAQLCGLGHYRMRGFVTVQTAEEFQKWMDEKVKEQSEPDPFK